MEQLKTRFVYGLMVALHITVVLSGRAQQPLVLQGVPPDATVQCLSDVPGGLMSAVGVIPFGITSNLLVGHSIGDSITVSMFSLGNWGKLNLCGINMSSTPNFIYYMMNGVSCIVSVGDSVLTGAGNNGLTQGFNARLAINPIVVMPVVASFPIGTSTVTVQGFIVAQLLSCGGAGSSWEGLIKLLSMETAPPNVTASGICGAATNVVFGETQSQPTNNCNNVITRVWTATDVCGNTASATQTIVIADSTPPSIMGPTTIIVPADLGQCSASNVSLGTASAGDNCFIPPLVTNNAPAVFPMGTNQVIWTATDSCCNSATCTQTVIVVDTQRPTMICPSNILVSATDLDGAIVAFTVAATDNCGSNVTVNCTPGSGTKFGVGTTPVNCTATDGAGNTTNGSFSVTVVDDTTFQITSITQQDNDIVLTWMMPQSWTGVVQKTVGDVDGGFSNSFGDVGAPFFLSGTGFATTNYIDVGGATNAPARFYRVRLAQ